MIKSDFRYIIKRILIGVGICLVLGFVNSCDVKAYGGSDYIITNGKTDQQEASIYYDEENNNIVLWRKNYSPNTTTINLDTYPYIICEARYGRFECYYSQNEFYMITTDFSVNSNYYNGFYSPTKKLNEITFLTNSSNSVNIIGSNDYMTNRNGRSDFDSINKARVLRTFTIKTYDITNNTVGGTYNNNTQNFIPNLISTINSLGIVKNKNQEENVITSYTFNPTFTNFNLDNFTYQYKIGNGDWLGIGVNNYTFNININTTVYFRVLKKSDNSVVDSRSITITNIMKYNDNVNNNYNVKYSSENRNVQGNQSAPAKLVDTVVVHFEYYPKQSNLKYQYQFVKSGDNLSTWFDMSSQDYDRDYSVNDNGIMYNRILDENDNVLYSSTFTVNSIGMLLNDEDLSWYENLFGKIDYGSGIGSIFFLPVDLLNVYKTAVESGVCNDYNFGSLFGHNLSMPCLNIRSLVGNNIYNFIDLVGAFCIILALIHFVVDTYDGLMFMNLQDRIREDEKIGRRLL